MEIKINGTPDEIAEFFIMMKEDEEALTIEVDAGDVGDRAVATLYENKSKKSKYGKIIQLKKGIEIDGIRIENLLADSIKTEKLENYVLVTCTFLADEFEINPKQS